MVLPRGRRRAPTSTCRFYLAPATLDASQVDGRRDRRRGSPTTTASPGRCSTRWPPSAVDVDAATVRVRFTVSTGGSLGARTVGVSRR